VIKLLLLSLLLLISSACSLNSRSEQKKLRDLFSQKQYPKALEFLETTELKTDPTNRLLYLMEKGRILFASDKFHEASVVFIEANELVDKLYTKSIKQEIASALLSDNSKNYYGSIFERSMLYYYQAMSFIKLYEIEQSESLKNKYIYQARASLLAWDSFFQDIRRRSGLQTLYRDSLIGKVLAASVHELIGKKSDRNIALQLYKDALGILQTQGLTYKNFNSKSIDYITAIKENKKIEKSSINKTKNYESLEDFLHFKVLSLTKSLRSYEYAKQVKLLNPSQSVVDELKKKTNVDIFFEEGMINPIEAKMYSYTLKSAIDSIESKNTRAVVAGIGLPVLSYFAMGPLGLGISANSGTTSFYGTHNLGSAVTQEAGIEFEMPAAKEPTIVETEKIEFYDEDGKKLITSSEFTLYGALNDIEFLQANERASNSYKKVGTKIAIKHIIAIIAAFKTYDHIKKSSGELFAKPAAFTQYILSAKAIAASEKADVRHWTTLPSLLRTSSNALPPGKYTVKLNKSAGAKGSVLVELGKIEVTKESRQVFTFSLN